MRAGRESVPVEQQQQLELLPPDNSHLKCVNCNFSAALVTLLGIQNSSQFRLNFTILAGFYHSCQKESDCGSISVSTQMWPTYFCDLGIFHSCDGTKSFTMMRDRFHLIWNAFLQKIKSRPKTINPGRGRTWWAEWKWNVHDLAIVPIHLIREIAEIEFPCICFLLDTELVYCWYFWSQIKGNSTQKDATKTTNYY